MSVRVFPERINKGEKTYPECRRNYHIGWVPKYNKREKRRKPTGIGILLSDSWPL
jgi:hypothetical protein